MKEDTRDELKAFFETFESKTPVPLCIIPMFTKDPVERVEMVLDRKSCCMRRGEDLGADLCETAERIREVQKAVVSTKGD